MLQVGGEEKEAAVHVKLDKVVEGVRTTAEKGLDHVSDFADGIKDTVGNMADRTKSKRDS